MPIQVFALFSHIDFSSVFDVFSCIGCLCMTSMGSACWVFAISSADFFSQFKIFKQVIRNILGTNNFS